jgi:hypothetical protein
VLPVRADMQDVEQALETEPVVGEADVSAADLAQVVTQFPGFKRPWLAPVVIVAAWLLLLSFARPELNLVSVLTVALPLMFLVAMIDFFRRAARRAWIAQALANIGGRTTFRFDDYGFTSESSLRQYRLAWASLARAVETPHAVLIYTTPRSVLIVPKRAFTDADVRVLSRRLTERITPKPLPGAGLLAGGIKRTLVLWVVLVLAFLAIWQFLDQGAQPRRQDLEPENTARPGAMPSRGGEASDVDSSP